MSEKEFTYAEVKDHNSKKDLYLVIHDTVYNSSTFVDEHPGGEEVLLDAGGQDATEAFEDVGHSDEAREILEGLKIGSLKRMPGDPKPSASAPQPATSGAGQASGGGGTALYAAILIGGVIAYGAYQYLQANQEKA